jgi:hypothetical protein
VKIFPAQINSAYSFVRNGDTAEMIRFGLWNEELAARWKATADFFIVEEKQYIRWKDFFTADNFDEYVRSPEGTSCSEDSQLRIFRRK